MNFSFIHIKSPLLIFQIKLIRNTGGSEVITNTNHKQDNINNMKKLCKTGVANSTVKNNSKLNQLVKVNKSKGSIVTHSNDVHESNVNSPTNYDSITNDRNVNLLRKCNYLNVNVTTQKCSTSSKNCPATRSQFSLGRWFTMQENY